MKKSKKATKPSRSVTVKYYGDKQKEQVERNAKRAKMSVYAMTKALSLMPFSRIKDLLK
jgi:hypothetical protein